ncbi:MAG: hypothetical protein LBQ09_07310 [Acidobacteriaceae bacterium]|jgi:hypothetical protein|nr:hypothetical protein [Acidobacteriaceae bacterium]
MKSVAGGLIAAIVLFVVGAVAWNEAKMTRRLASAHERLSTLHYDLHDDLDDSNVLLAKLPVNMQSTSTDIAQYRASVSYWRAQYPTLTEMISGSKQMPTDAQLLFVAANASFRDAAPQMQESQKVATDSLDRVIQSYAEVLRKDPHYTDAAYNYEYVTRLRDNLAKGPAPSARNAKDKKEPPKKPENVSVDLPAGPTIHGRPGGPPDDSDMSDFKTISPMRYDEREEQNDPGRGAKIQRKS